jgi:HAD superfamily hydrolase (TIGR01549 family)
MQSVSEFINQYGQAFRDEYVNFEIELEKKNYQSYKIIQKTLDLLQEFYQQNKNLYLLTSNSRATVLPILEELKITNDFNKIITLDDVRNLKPSPIPFELIYVEGSDKKQYLMIGDSVSDKGFAQNAGIDYLDVP